MGYGLPEDAFLTELALEEGFEAWTL